MLSVRDPQENWRKVQGLPRVNGQLEAKSGNRSTALTETISAKFFNRHQEDGFMDNVTTGSRSK